MKALLLANLLLLAGATRAVSETPPDGPALFTLNCSACHLLDQMLVGPSLVEMRTLYLNKPDAFVKWCVAPGRKRVGAIEMPSMTHIGEPGLRSIHAHVMAISKGVVAKKIARADPFAAAPSQTVRPLVQRMFLPDAGPAAIGVALDDKTSICWDAGPCRLRYAWTGGFIDGYPYWKANGSTQAKIVGKIRYTETAPLLPGTAKFAGYQITGGLPVFRYSIGARQITETFTALSGGVGITRTFTITPAPELVLQLPAQTTCDTGVLMNGRLTLTAAQAARFTLTHRFP
jgi:cytochrome c551/c552